MGSPYLWEVVAAEHAGLRLGVPNTGRLFDECARLVRAAFDVDIAANRGLYHRVAPDVTVLCARSNDLPSLLAHGVLDLAITGRDYAFESGEEVSLASDLGLVPSEICVLVPGAEPLAPHQLAGRRIASQYPRLARAWVAATEPRAEVVTVSGAAELYPRLGLADAIVDNVTTGVTAADNGLVAIDVVMRTSGCLFAPVAGAPPRLAALAEEVAGVIARAAESPPVLVADGA